MIQPNSNMFANERPVEYSTSPPSQQWSQYTNARARTDEKPRPIATQGVPLGRTASLTTPEAPIAPDTVHISKRATLGDKLMGTAETLAGRVTKNRGMIERGQVRKGV